MMQVLSEDMLITHNKTFFFFMRVKIMTEKRFRVILHDEWDKELDYVIDSSTEEKLDAYQCWKLLNQLWEENKILKELLVDAELTIIGEFSIHIVDDENELHRVFEKGDIEEIINFCRT